MIKPVFLQIGVCVLLIAACAGVLLAQTPNTGSIVVVAEDQNGAVVRDALQHVHRLPARVHHHLRIFLARLPLAQMVKALAEQLFLVIRLLGLEIFRGGKMCKCAFEPNVTALRKRAG